MTRNVNAISDISPVFAEQVECLTADRDARVIAAPDGDADFACVEMDDVGYGEYGRVVTKRMADALVAEGFVRDGR